MEQIKENKMGTARMLPLIVSMSLPSMFSMLIQALYNIVDSMFVARFDPTALAAVSLVFPMQMLVISIAVGTGIGINSLVSRRLGEKRIEEASNAATHGILLAIFSWILMVLLSAIFTKPFYGMFTHDNPKLFQMACDYSYIVIYLSFGAFIHISIEKTLQATGNMIYPMFFQLIGAVINIILDPIMIFGMFGFPQLGIRGAAIATVIGQIIAMLCAVYIAFFKTHAIHISFKNFKFHMKTVRDIYAVGIPSIIMQSIGSVLITFLNKILVGFTETAVSVLGVYFKLQSFIFMPVFGLMQGIMPIMGYSYGAKYKNRLISALKIGCIFAISILLIGMLIFLIFPTQLLQIFNNDPELLRIGTPALRIISICFPSAAICIMFSTIFQAVGRGNYSLIVSLLRQLIGILPIAYLLSRIGLEYFWWSFPIAECLSLFVSIWLFIRLYNNDIKTLNE